MWAKSEVFSKYITIPRTFNLKKTIRLSKNNTYTLLSLRKLASPKPTFYQFSSFHFHAKSASHELLVLPHNSVPFTIITEQIKIFVNNAIYKNKIKKQYLYYL